MIGFKQLLKYPIQNRIDTRRSDFGQFSPHMLEMKYHRKNGSQHSMNAPIMTPKVFAALCSFRIFRLSCRAAVRTSACACSFSLSSRAVWKLALLVSFESTLFALARVKDAFVTGLSGTICFCLARIATSCLLASR